MPQVSLSVVEQPVFASDGVAVCEGVAQQSERLEPPLGVVESDLLALTVLHPVSRPLLTRISEKRREGASMLPCLGAAAEKHVERSAEGENADILSDQLSVRPRDHLPLDAPVQPARGGVTLPQGCVERGRVLGIEPAAEQRRG